MGAFLTVDVIAMIAGAILRGKNTCPRDEASGRSSGKACWNGQKERWIRGTISLTTTTLEEVPKVRYNETLAMLGGMEDPYATIASASSEASIDWQHWPDIQYPDIYNYFIATPSGHTKQELKAYKSLEGYKYFIDGWVSYILVLPMPSCPSAYLVSGRMKHSQRLSASPLKPWAAVQKDGVVVCAHCDCMAGREEACSHIAALLFTLDANTQVKKSLSCTSVPCYCLPQ